MRGQVAAKIRAEIKRLETSRDECTEGPIKELIESWIAEQKQKLIRGNNRE
jgi:hypothetical protein